MYQYPRKHIYMIIDIVTIIIIIEEGNIYDLQNLNDYNIYINIIKLIIITTNWFE